MPFPTSCPTLPNKCSKLYYMSNSGIQSKAYTPKEADSEKRQTGFEMMTTGFSRPVLHQLNYQGSSADLITHPRQANIASQTGKTNFVTCIYMYTYYACTSCYIFLDAYAFGICNHKNAATIASTIHYELLMACQQHCVCIIHVPFHSLTQPSSPDDASMVPVTFQDTLHTCAP